MTSSELPVQNPVGGVAPQKPSPEATPPKAAPSITQGVAARDFSMLIALLVISGFFAVTVPSFLGARNLSMLAIELSITAVLALGMLLVLLPGHIDLSAGSSVALFGAIGAVLIFKHGWPAPLAMGASFAAGLLVYFLMGLLIIKQKIPAFIITLGGLLVFRGLQWMVIQNATIPVSVGGRTNIYSALTTYYVPPLWSWIIAAAVIGLMGYSTLSSYRHRKTLPGITVDGELQFMRWFVSAQLIVIFVLVCNQYRGLPLPALILGIAAFLVQTLTRETAWGRYLYAIGGNEEAAFVSGVPIHRVAIGAFTIMGAIVCLTGFLQTAYAGASTTTVGTLLELDAVAACVIGGTSLRGGRGTVSGVLFGSLIMAVLLNGMTLMAVSPEIKYVARGSVLALAVWMDVRLARK
jgi:D-xylose transport system permease protein